MDETIETFETEAEAISFIEGLETAANMIDDNHLSWEQPAIVDKQWQVAVSYAC